MDHGQFVNVPASLSPPKIADLLDLLVAPRFLRRTLGSLIRPFTLDAALVVYEPFLDAP